MNEIWKPILGYEGLYEVSNYGKVKSYVKNQNGRILKNSVQKPRENYKRYSVTLVKDGKNKIYSVHTLVATAFCEKPEGCEQVNHKDLNPLNNCADNLEWCTPKQNIKHALDNGKFKTKPLDKELLMDFIFSRRMTNKEIADYFGVGQNHVLSEIKRYKIEIPYMTKGKYKVTEAELSRMLQNGMDYLEISKFLGCHPTNAWRLIKRFKSALL